jgi:hypothetical protein
MLGPGCNRAAPLGKDQMFKLRRHGCIALFVALALTAAPAAASAESLYATPSPASGADCSVASPCALLTAMSKAATGDAVVIGAGTYGSGSYNDGGKSLTIKGAVIGSGRPIVNGGFELTGSGTRISDVQATSMKVGDGAEANRVVSINNTFGDGCEIETSGGTIANSICATESPFFSGLSTQSTGGSGTMIVRNDTMIGHHGFYSSSAGMVTISDSIAMRNSSASADDASLGSGETVSLVKSYALHQYPGQLAKSEVEPLLKEPIFRGAGEYREAANSPSIEFGSTSTEYGELDLDGNLRKIGARTDIGAYEFVPDAPSLGTPSTTRGSSTSATVSVPINPNSGRTYYRVEYGPTAGYGSSTATLALPAATTPATVEVELTELPTDSTVHYSIVGIAAEARANPISSPAGTTAEAPTRPALHRKQRRGAQGTAAVRPVGDQTLDGLRSGGLRSECRGEGEGRRQAPRRRSPGRRTLATGQVGKQGAMKLRVSAELQRLVRHFLEENPGARAKIFVTGTFVTAAGERRWES